MGEKPRHDSKNDSASILQRMFGPKTKNKADTSKNSEFMHPDSRLDEVQLKEFEKRLEKLIKIAAKKTKRPKLMHDKNKLNYVKRIIKETIKKWAKERRSTSAPHLTPLDLATIALLGVLSVQITGAQRIYLQAGSRLTNDFAAPCFNPYASENYAVINEPKQIDLAYGDSLGLEFQAIIDLIGRGDILAGLTAEFIEGGYIKVKKSNEEENKKKKAQEDAATTPFEDMHRKMTAPTLTPYDSKNGGGEPDDDDL